MVNHPNRSKRHTPGPWREDNADINGVTHYFVAGERGILLGMWSEGCGLGHQADANRRLMLAAPDLLAALKDVVRIADRKTVEFDAARAAVKKAEG